MDYFRFREVLSCEQSVAIDDSEISSVCDDCRSDLSADVTHGAVGRREVHPISYGTNWTPRPSFSGYKESQKKYQPKPLRTPVTVTGGTIRHEEDHELSSKQLRHRRGCHTVVPSNSSDKSSGCWRDDVGNWTLMFLPWSLHVMLFRIWIDFVIEKFSASGVCHFVDNLFLKYTLRRIAWPIFLRCLLVTIIHSYTDEVNLIIWHQTHNLLQIHKITF